MADGDLTRLVVTYTYICISMLSSMSRPHTFGKHGMLPYRYFLNMLSRDFGVCLIPDYYPCTDPRPVSCYALFE